jgi:hypothetical protein
MCSRSSQHLRLNYRLTLGLKPLSLLLARCCRLPSHTDHVDAVAGPCPIGDVVPQVCPTSRDLQARWGQGLLSPLGIDREVVYHLPALQDLYILLHHLCWSKRGPAMGDRLLPELLKATPPRRNEEGLATNAVVISGFPVMAHLTEEIVRIDERARRLRVVLVMTTYVVRLAAPSTESANTNGLQSNEENTWFLRRGTARDRNFVCIPGASHELGSRGCACDDVKVTNV